MLSTGRGSSRRSTGRRGFSEFNQLFASKCVHTLSFCHVIFQLGTLVKWSETSCIAFHSFNDKSFGLSVKLCLDELEKYLIFHLLHCMCSWKVNHSQAILIYAKHLHLNVSTKEVILGDFVIKALYPNNKFWNKSQLFCVKLIICLPLPNNINPASS